MLFTTTPLLLCHRRCGKAGMLQRLLPRSVAVRYTSPDAQDLCTQQNQPANLTRTYKRNHFPGIPTSPTILAWGLQAPDVHPLSKASCQQLKSFGGIRARDRSCYITFQIVGAEVFTFTRQTSDHIRTCTQTTTAGTTMHSVVRPSTSDTEEATG